MGLVALLGVGLLADPVQEPDLDVTRLPSVPHDPAGLEAWIDQREARFDDITPGAEKHLAWATPRAPSRTSLALVYLHGFSATRQEVAPLCEQVGEALQANVFLTRLRGHGRTGEAFAASTLTQWLEDALEALAVGHATGDRVVLVGTSTGATLATWLAARGAPVDALVLLSPNFAPRARGASLLTLPGRDLLIRLVVGDTRSWEPDSPLQGRYWTHSYPSRALLPMADLVELTRRSDFGRIDVPVLVLYAPGDQVVRTELVPERIAEMSSPHKRIVEVDYATSASQHILAGDILSPSSTDRVAAEITDFLDAAF